ncbi:MAG: RibD family protein, partial [Bacteroidota bacterium]
GAHTVVTDDPKLTVRPVRGRHPVRIVLDGALRVSGKERVFDATVRTILLTNRRNLAGRSAVLRRLTSAGVEVLGLDGRGMIHPAQLLAALAGEGITSVLVEGGPTTIAQFISARCGDKVHVFLGAVVLGGGLSSLELRRPFSVKSPLRLRDSMFRTLDDGGVLLEGYPEFP